MAEISIDDFLQSAEEGRKIIAENENDPVLTVEKVFQIWWHWADFEMYIITPTFPELSPPHRIEPEVLSSTQEKEFVYPILDLGFKLSTSKGADMYTAGMSNCKLFYTIEKMVYLLIEKLKNEGIDQETEVQIAFGGHLFAQRKAFESIINLKYNVVVTNFEPGAWGEQYLRTVKEISNRGYGYPTEAPRETFRQSHGAAPTLG